MEPRTFSLRYRPQIFEEIFDQEHIKRTLVNAIEANRLAHAYLFTGPRGVGKTTTARILAKSLNCEQGPTAHPCNQCSACTEIRTTRSLDVLEIDGASNRGIDQIRELRENIRYRPTSGRYRIYIIDEVHMLTPEAFNALLKTLEEPPAHVIFIFATTEPHKVPATILSRCQRFDFKRIPPSVIVERLNMIIQKEGLKVDKDAVRLIADIADGGLRDAESVLEQITTFKEGKVTEADVTELLGIVPHERFAGFLEAVRKGDESALLSFMEEVFTQGYDVAEFYFGLVGFMRALLFASLGMSSERSAFPEDVLAQAEHYTPKEIARMLERLLKSEEAFKRSQQKQVFVETLALALMEPESRGNPEPAPDKAAASKKPKPGKTAASTANKVEITHENPAPENPEQSLPGNSNQCEEEPSGDQSRSALELWGRFLEDITREHSFVTLALEGSIPVEERANTLYVAIRTEKASQMGFLEHEREGIEKKFSALAGKKVRLAFQLSESKEPDSTPEKKNAVDDVLDIFKGEIVR